MPQPLTDAINALTAYANTVTGASDQTLSEAVATLASGYGSGGFSAGDIVARTPINGDVVYNGTQTVMYDGLFAKTNITSFSSPSLTGAETGTRAFFQATSLKTLSMPNLAINHTGKCNDLCRDCTSLETVYLPKMIKWGSYSFSGCTSLHTVDISECTELNTCTFADCNIQTIDLPKCTRMSNQSFLRNHNLTAVILRASSVCYITNINVFQDTPLRGYGGTFSGHVYVPSALIASYKTASNWSTLYSNYADIFAPIEGSIYE